MQDWHYSTVVARTFAGTMNAREDVESPLLPRVGEKRILLSEFGPCGGTLVPQRPR
jgi:hypothetical protein